MTLIDSVARFIPEILGHEASATEDSFADGLLDCPHYTRLEVLEGMKSRQCYCRKAMLRYCRWRLEAVAGPGHGLEPELLENLALTEEQASYSRVQN